MIKSLLIKLLMKYGSSLLYELIKMILGKVKDRTDTKLDDNAYNAWTKDEHKIKNIIDDNSTEIKSIIKKFKK